MDLILKKNDEEIEKDFFDLKTFSDVARLLEIEPYVLSFILNKNNNYKHFTIKKKSGGTRDIYAPISSLKILQKKLNYILNLVFYFRPSVHGFVKGKSIVSNAGEHNQKKNVLNLDLEDFFPKIHFGRIQGMFLGKPYSFPKEVARTLSKITTYAKSLPQGAPTSPIVSNMICSRLDKELQEFAKKNYCDYTRYGDDITFSNTNNQLPAEVAVSGDTLGEGLINIIQSNKFVINSKKIRLQKRLQRQEVTGLTVNDFPNVKRKFVRQVRAMLHAWETYDYIPAERAFHSQYCNLNNVYPESHKPSFKAVVEGRIAFIKMVKGKENPVFLRIYKKFCILSGRPFPYENLLEASDEMQPMILREFRTKITRQVTQCNALYNLKNAGDLFQLTNKFTGAIEFLDNVVRNRQDFGEFIDRLYFIFWEGPGREKEKFPNLLKTDNPVIWDIINLRTEFRHDEEHSNKNVIQRKKEIADSINKYSGKLTLDQLSEIDFFRFQKKLLKNVTDLLEEVAVIIRVSVSGSENSKITTPPTASPAKI